MEIKSPLHALMLLQKNILVRRKTRLRSRNGLIYLFVRIDSQMYPSIVLEDKDGHEQDWNYKTLRHNGLEIIKTEFTIVPFYD